MISAYTLSLNILFAFFFKTPTVFGSLFKGVIIRTMFMVTGEQSFQCVLMMLHYFKCIGIDMHLQDTIICMHSIYQLFTGRHKCMRLRCCPKESNNLSMHFQLRHAFSSTINTHTHTSHLVINRITRSLETKSGLVIGWLTETSINRRSVNRDSTALLLFYSVHVNLLL